VSQWVSKSNKLYLHTTTSDSHAIRSWNEAGKQDYKTCPYSLVIFPCPDSHWNKYIKMHKRWDTFLSHCIVYYNNLIYSLHNFGNFYDFCHLSCHFYSLGPCTLSPLTSPLQSHACTKSAHRNILSVHITFFYSLYHLPIAIIAVWCDLFRNWERMY